jgi:hypothetical protein
MVAEFRVDGLQTALIPSCVSARAKEIRPRVVVNAMHFPSLLAEIVHHL